MTDELELFVKEMAGLLDTLQNLQCQGIRETVTEESAFAAQFILKELRMEQTGDALLFASAINSLNAFARQDNDNRERIGESYKTAPGDLCVFLSDHPDEPMAIELHEENGKITMVTEIAGLQFSYGRLELDERTMPFYVPEPERQSLAQDSLYEQNLSETILAAALNNTNLRQGVASDGRVFSTALEEAMEQYRGGELSLEDLLKDAITPSDLAGTFADVLAQTIVMLYDAEYRTFIQAIRERTLMPFLTQSFENTLGYTIPGFLYDEGKYALETFRAVSAEWGEVSPGIGIRVFYVRNRTEEHFTLAFASEQGGFLQLGILQLLGWVSVNPAETPGKVSFRYRTDSNDTETISPKLQAGLLRDDLLCSGSPLIGSTRLCTFYYETARRSPAEWPDESDSGEHPDFYASEGDQCMDYLEEVLKGEPIPDTVHERLEEAGDGRQTDRDDVWEPFCRMVREVIETEPASLILIACRMSEDLPSITAEVSDALEGLAGIKLFLQTEKNQTVPEGTELLVRLRAVPGAPDFQRTPHQMVFYDPVLAALEQDELKAEESWSLSSRSIPVHRFVWPKALGYSDSGEGNGLLVRMLYLGNTPIQTWDSFAYSIRINDRADPVAEDGIAEVILPGTITSELIHSEAWWDSSERLRLYQELRKGIRGAVLTVEDNQLYQELSKKLVEYQDSLKQVCSTVDEALKEAEENLTNPATSASSNRIHDRAAEALGGYAWNLLQDESRDWVVSALVSYYDMMQTSLLLDYSGVNLLLSKVFEREGQIRLAEGYVTYMQERYGDGYLDLLPEELVTQKKDGTLQPVQTDRVTLGAFPFIMGFDLSSKVANQNDYDHFSEYAAAVLLRDGTGVFNQLQSLAVILNRVCLRYRDPAAHSVAIDAQTATECVNYCVLEDRTIGVMMDLFR